MYRERSKAEEDEGDLVTALETGNPVDAELAKSQLLAEGIRAHVVEGASFNPIVNSAVGVRVLVSERNLHRARTLLRTVSAVNAADDGEGTNVVRCPRCELAYCYYERARSDSLNPVIDVALFAWIFTRGAPKRWHCHKCGHVWDDPKEGPGEPTKLQPEDRVPAFRLRRGHGGLGCGFAFVASFFIAPAVAVIVPKDGAMVAMCLVMGTVVALGIVVGRAMTYDLCSTPGCREQLPRGVDECPKCGGFLSGVIRTGEEHYSASADVRRELAKMRARGKKPNGAKRKGRAKAEPGDRAAES